MLDEVTLGTYTKKVIVESYSCVKIQTTLGMTLGTILHNYVDGEPTWKDQFRDRWRAHLELDLLGSSTDPALVLLCKTY